MTIRSTNHVDGSCVEIRSANHEEGVDRFNITIYYIKYNIIIPYSIIDDN